MTIARKLTGITTAAAIAATALVPMATTASAEGWRDGRRGDNHYGYNDNRDFKRHRGDHDGRRRYVVRKKKDNTGKYIALGVGALMLGVILSEAGRR